MGLRIEVGLTRGKGNGPLILWAWGGWKGEGGKLEWAGRLEKGTISALKRIKGKTRQI